MSSYNTTPIKYKLVTKNQSVVYVPLATAHNYGLVKAGNGLVIKNGIIALRNEITRTLSFVTYEQFEMWISGDYQRDDGFSPSELNVGDIIRLGEKNVTDYWCKSKSNPMTIEDFLPCESEQNYVRYDAEQNLSEESKKIARDNIGAADDNDLENVKEALDDKVDKVAGDYYINNSTTGIELSDDAPLPDGAIPPATGIRRKTSMSLRSGAITFYSGISGDVNNSARLTLGSSRPILELNDEHHMAAGGPNQTYVPYPSDGSPLSTLYDLEKKVSTEAYEWGAEGEKYSRILNTSDGMILTSTKDETTNRIDLTPTQFTLNNKNIALEEYVDNKVSEITSIQIRNKTPNIVVYATVDTVQNIATQYIIDNYQRQPKQNDGLFITLTDSNNDIVKYAYYNGSWVNVGINDVDLSDYVNLGGNQTITGNKDFLGNLTKRGKNVATEEYVNTEIETVDKDSKKVLILGANGTIGINANFVVEDAISFVEYRNNLTEFLFSGIIPVTGEVDLTKNVKIDFGDTSYYLYDAVDTGRRLTLGDLNFALRESLDTGYNYLFRTVFFNNNDLVGFAVLPDRDEVLSLNSDQMDDYLADGGLPNGQLAICSKVITNGYVVGGIYRFKITYPSTYEWEELSSGGSGSVAIDNQTITKNDDNEIQTVSIKNGAVDVLNNTLVNDDFRGIVHLTINQMKKIHEDGSITIDGTTFRDDGSVLFVVDEDSLGELTLTVSGSMMSSVEKFDKHVRIMIEFETDGMHYGSDFILHPFDNSICLVQYGFIGHTGTAYLDENGYVQISIPDGLTITNIKGHFVEFGG